MYKAPKVKLYIETSRAYGRGILKGISKYVDLHRSWDIELESPFYLKHRKNGFSYEDPEIWLDDGIIMREFPEHLRPAVYKVPIVFVNYVRPAISGSNSVKTNDNEIAEMAINYFLSKGYKNFGFIGYPKMFWSENREQVFRQKLDQAGLQYLCYESPEGLQQQIWRQEEFVVADWLRSLPKPTALMACNDDRAQQVAQAARVADVRVPDEVSILGVDNDDFICTLSVPTLSSIELNLEKAGYEAAEVLDRMMNGEDLEDIIITVNPMRVVERRSTDIMAIDSDVVKEAIRFIEHNSNHHISVNDVAEALTISRRMLERRFKVAVNDSINNIIRRARVENICRMLLQTDMTISEIARDLDFKSVDHISRYFKRVKKITPGSYRRKYGNR